MTSLKVKLLFQMWQIGPPQQTFNANGISQKNYLWETFIFHILLNYGH